MIEVEIKTQKKQKTHQTKKDEKLVSPDDRQKMQT